MVAALQSGLKSLTVAQQTLDTMLNVSSVLAGGRKPMSTVDEGSKLGFLVAVTGQVEAGDFPGVDRLYCKYDFHFGEKDTAQGGGYVQQHRQRHTASASPAMTTSTTSASSRALANNSRVMGAAPDSVDSP